MASPDRHVIANQVDTLLSNNDVDGPRWKAKESSKRLSYLGPSVYPEGLGRGKIGCLVRLQPQGIKQLAVRCIKGFPQLACGGFHLNPERILIVDLGIGCGGQATEYASHLRYC